MIWVSYLNEGVFYGPLQQLRGSCWPQEHPQSLPVTPPPPPVPSPVDHSPTTQHNTTRLLYNKQNDKQGTRRLIIHLQHNTMICKA